MKNSSGFSFVPLYDTHSLYKGKMTGQYGSLGSGPFPADHKFLVLSATCFPLLEFHGDHANYEDLRRKQQTTK